MRRFVVCRRWRSIGALAFFNSIAYDGISISRVELLGFVVTSSCDGPTPLHKFAMKFSVSIVFILLALLSTLQLVKAQCSPTPNAGGTTFAYGVTDSITPLVFEPQPFVACDNALLYYYGNNPDTIYMESSSRLVVKSSFNLVVYLRNNCQLRIDTTSPAIKHFRQIFYDTTYTTFVDTVGITVVNGLTACPGLSFAYSAFPNGLSPCTLPTGIQNLQGSINAEVSPIPASEYINISLSQTAFPVELTLYGTDGKMLRNQVLTFNTTKLDVSGLPSGMYMLTLSNSKSRLVRRILVE